MRLDAFIGEWLLERTIEDRRNGLDGVLTGSARFLSVRGGLAYREEGRLTYGTALSVSASRRHLWRDMGAGMIEVLFADGRSFHRFPIDEPCPVAEHHCPPDHYRVRYDFRRWPLWRATWQVQGPAKDYALVSHYRPAGQPVPTAA